MLSFLFFEKNDVTFSIYRHVIAVYANKFTIFSEAAIEARFFFNLMQEYKEILKPCLTQFTFRLFTPP
jgi:hypothetical protein